MFISSAVVVMYTHSIDTSEVDINLKKVIYFLQQAQSAMLSQWRKAQL